MSDEREPFGDPPPRADEIDLAKVHGSILREHDEPAEGRESVPLWLVTIIMALVFWGGGYLVYYSGDFRADVFSPRNDFAAADSNDPATLGQRTYAQNCILCHQANGAGVPGIYPPLAGSEWVMAKGWHGDNQLVSIVLFGMQGPVEVGGQSFNNSMPTWKFLSDEEIATLLTYIRGQWGNSAIPITPEFVRQVRAKNAARVEPWSQNELKTVPPEQQELPLQAPSPVMKARQ